MRTCLGRPPFPGLFKRKKLRRPHSLLWGTLATSFLVLGVVGWLQLELRSAPEEWPVKSSVAVDKLACVLTSSVARIQVQSWRRSCAESDSFIDLTVGPAEASISGWATSGPKSIREVGLTRLSAREGSRQLAELVAAAQRPEIARRCVSSLVVARIYYWCGAEKLGPLLLATHMCTPWEVEFGGKRTSKVYARAHGISTWVDAILAGFPGQEVAAEVNRESRARDAIYEAEHQAEPNWLEGESYP